ncbi:MAG: SpoIIE family protein phosphatase [bacterium]|nr:SpoIIE family protein phosphatase [bacterium]
MAESSDSLTEVMSEELFQIEATRNQKVSPMNFISWRYILRAVVLSILTGIVDIFFKDIPVLGTWVQAALAGGAWYFAVRFLLLSVKGHRIWSIFLLISAAGVLISPWFFSGYLGAMTVSVLFLLFRRYRTYRYLTSRRRAAVWLLGLTTLTLLLINRRMSFDDNVAWHMQLSQSIIIYSVHLLRVFWVLSVINIFLHMRLHFMRIKPKLAASAIFISLVPILLLCVIALIGTWSLMGEGRAHRGKSIINNWCETHDQNLALDAIPWAERITYRAGDTMSGQPDWLPRFLAVVGAEDALPEDTGEEFATPAIEFEGEDEDDYHFIVTPPMTTWEDRFWNPADTTMMFCVGSELWLLKLEDVEQGTPSIRGYHVSSETMDYLSTILAGDVTLSLGIHGTISVDGDDEDEVGEAVFDSTRNISGHLVRSEKANFSDSFAEKGFWFGVASVNCINLNEDYFTNSSIVLHLRMRPADLRRDLFDSENPVSRGIMVGFLIITGTLLFVMIMAIYFGTRITGGITSAVKALHTNTLKLARGDLSSRVDIPNEDEFGDLADSFNEMTQAIKQGRQEAVHRERLERELLMARNIQERLFPHSDPSLAGFEITGTSLPSRQVGGDYFDFLGLGAGRTGIAIGDVSGKGVPAALLMSNLQASLQGQVIHPSTVAEVVQRINDLLVRSTDDNMFATFVYCLLDTNNANLTLTNAGHNPPILLRKNGSVLMLETGGLILGMLPKMSYKQETVHMDPGDVLILFTDGITEAEVTIVSDDLDVAADGAADSVAADDDVDEVVDDSNMYGEERLLQVLKDKAHLSAIEIREAILKSVNSFTKGSPQSDDITLVVIKRQDVQAVEG